MRPLEEVWKELDSKPGSPDGFLAISLDATAPCRVFAAIDRSQNVRSLLFEVPRRALPSGLKLPSASGFASDLRHSVAEATQTSTLILRLGDTRYLDVFTVLATDVAMSTLAADSPTEGVRRWVERLTTWHLFFRNSGGGRLTIEKQQGLFAELWFVRKHLSKVVGWATALEIWKGPEGGTQDFQWNRSAVEVKSCATGEPYVVTISSIGQLDPAPGIGLVLFAVLLTKGGAGEETLPQAVGRARDAAHASGGVPAQAGLDDRLREYGYLDLHAPAYEEMRYSVREERAMRVGDGFPRLRGAELPAGVGDVTYSLELGYCRKWEITPPELAASIKDSADGT